MHWSFDYKVTLLLSERVDEISICIYTYLLEYIPIFSLYFGNYYDSILVYMKNLIKSHFTSYLQVFTVYSRYILFTVNTKRPCTSIYSLCFPSIFFFFSNSDHSLAFDMEFSLIMECSEECSLILKLSLT